MIRKSTWQLLRLPFSIILLPVFLFVIYTGLDNLHIPKLIVVFLSVHFIFYPASNAYNSYIDQDESSIGGLKSPPKPTRELFNVSIILDIAGLFISLFISYLFFVINIFLVIISRCYSSRRIRLKKYPIISFLTVAVCQGSISYLNMYAGSTNIQEFHLLLNYDLIYNGIIAGMFVGAIYPISQIYQHDEDKRQGVKSISMLLGIRGTLFFSGLLFFIALWMLSSVFSKIELWIYLCFMAMPIGFFIWWLIKCWNNPAKANYKNTMIMALTSSMAMNLGLTILILLKI